MMTESLPPSSRPPSPSADDKQAAPVSAPWWLTGTVTWFGVGLSPRAPGTVGSLAALPFAAAMSWAAGPALAPAVLCLAALVVFLVGWWTSQLYVWKVRQKDPGQVVIDEVAAQWLTLAVAPMDPLAYGLGFLWFRVFDIFKPWPVNWVDRRLGGGLGIMADDIVAAGYAALALWGTLSLLS